MLVSFKERKQILLGHTSSVRQGSDDAAYHGSCNNSCNHFASGSMVYVCNRSVVYGARRHGFAEEIVWIIVTIVVCPHTVYAISPASIVVVSYAAFPSWNVVASAHLRRSATHHPASVGQRVRTAVGAHVGSVLVVLALRLASVVCIAVGRTAVIVTLYPVAVALVSAFASLSIGINTGQKH